MGMGIDTVFPENSNIFWNSASLSFKEKTLFLSNGSIDEAHTPFLAFYLPMRRISLGVSLWSYLMEVSVFDFYGSETGSINYGGDLFSVAGSIRLKKNLSLGVSINAVDDYITGGEMEDEHYSATFLNISLLWKLNKFNIGFTQFNVGEAEFKDLGEQIISGGKIGIGYSFNKLRIGFEFGGYDEENIVGFGGEYLISKKFKGRLGILGRGDDSGFAFGFTYNLKRFYLDFAYQKFDISGVTGQVGIGYSWGRKSLERVKKRKVKESVEKIEIKVKKGEKINVAVLDFEARPPLSPAEAGFISDFFRADLVRSPLLTLVDRNNMEKIFAEQGLQQTGCTTTECAVQLGKILNVRYIVTGSCGKLLNKYVITMNVIDVQSGKIVYSDDRSIDNPDLLRESIRQMTSDFLNSIK